MKIGITFYIGTRRNLLSLIYKQSSKNVVVLAKISAGMTVKTCVDALNPDLEKAEKHPYALVFNSCPKRAIF